MALDRGRLAKIDRRVFAELDHGEGPQMVKVPLSDAAWSTWKRYCGALGLTMGEGIAGLIDSELVAAVDDGGGNVSDAVFAIRADEQLAARETQIAVRELAMEAEEKQQRAWRERLRRREAELKVRQIRVDHASRLADQRHGGVPKVGRNDRCPCGSGLKHKHCHGLPNPQGR
jgi:hypothetical protein